MDNLNFDDLASPAFQNNRPAQPMAAARMLPGVQQDWRFCSATAWTFCFAVMLAVWLFLTSLATAAVVVGAGDSQTDKEMIQAFLENAKATASAEDLKKIKATVDAFQDSAVEAITEGLIEMYPEYADAVESADAENVDEATKRLTPLTQSKDKFLAADATFFLARTLMNSENYEDAIPYLDELTGDLGQFSPHRGPAMYFKGLAEAGLLKRKPAIKSLTDFLTQNPDAPERMRVSAWRLFQELSAFQAGKLEDVYRRMDFSRRRLQLAKTDRATQDQQDEIVKMLNKLIKEEEKKEASSSDNKNNKPSPKKQNQSQPSQSPSSPKPSKSQKGGSSKNANGQAIVKAYDQSPASPWSRLRDRSRDPANNAVKENLPARYRDMVERYMESANGDQDK